MILNLALGIIFLGSTAALWYLVSKRIPVLVAIPDDVIAKRLEEDSARIRVFLLRLKSFYTEGRIKDFFWGIVAKILHRSHIILMRVDNRTVSLLKRVRGNGGSQGASNGITVGEDELQKSSVSAVASLPDPMSHKSLKIEEVRPRKNDAREEVRLV
ncbi:MAG: hypothetical protein HYT98_00095 [Candidatus Sungbacteria bacterium]|nr:hypothetical protein [Candidatus Sungbacteria bacterium]